MQLYQITGSASFAARAALEELGAAYDVVNVHPRRRDELAEFGVANPLRRVPTLVDGDEMIYETGAVLTYLGDRFAAAGLAPTIGAPGRGAYLRWMAWLSNTLHTIWYRADPSAIAAAGAYLETELEGRDWCVGTSFTLVDIYLYMLTGWRSYNEEPIPFAGPNLEAHYARVGARAAIIRTRELDDLKPDFQRNHPELRAGAAV